MTVSKYKNPEEYKPGIVLRERGSGYDVPNARTIKLLSHNNAVRAIDRRWDVESKEEGPRGRKRTIQIRESTLRDKYALPPELTKSAPKPVGDSKPKPAPKPVFPKSNW